ncbi:MAG: extracellular solute-binding protein, partial [Clostridia bacterium]|nr:extracellular solute-binding protein [Clostridia bacterium]
SGVSRIEKINDESGNEQVKYNDLTAEEWLATLENGDYGGYEFRIATSRQYRFTPEEEMSGMVNPAIEKRNNLVNAKYNIVLREAYYEESELQAAISNSALAGTQFSDLVSVTMPTMANLASSGFIINLFSVPFFNAEASYLNGETVKNSVVNDYMYAIYDQATFYQEDFWCVFYNENLLRDGADSEIIKAVKEGKWTWDMLMRYAEEAASEVMEKRSPDFYTDTFGIGSFTDKNKFATAAFTSSGLSLFGDTFHKSLTYTMDSDAGNQAADIIRGIINSKSYIGLSGEEASKAFLEGRTAFFIYRVNYAKTVAETRLSWNLAPLPKMTEEQSKYFSYVGTTSAGLSVPAHQHDSARTGKVLNAILAASYINIDDAIKTNYITFCLRDNDAAITLSTIFRNPVMDIGTIYAEGYDRLSFLTNETILKAVKSDISFAYMYINNASALAALNENEFR